MVAKTGDTEAVSVRDTLREGDTDLLVVGDVVEPKDTLGVTERDMLNEVVGVADAGMHALKMTLPAEPAVPAGRPPPPYVTALHTASGTDELQTLEPPPPAPP